MTDYKILIRKRLIRAKLGDKVASSYEDLLTTMEGQEHAHIRDVLRDDVAAYLMACAQNRLDYKTARQEGGRIGIASSQTFNRRKYELRRAGLITEAPVHTDSVGRPRHSLNFNDEGFRRLFKRSA